MIPNVILAGLCFLLLFIPFNEGGGSPTALFLNHTLIFLLITLQAFYGIQMAESRRQNADYSGPSKLPTASYLTLTAFVLWSFSSLFISQYIYTTLLEIMNLLSYLAVFSLCQGICQRKNYRNILLLALLLSIFIQAAFALYGHLTSPGLLRSGFININDFATFLVVGFILLASQIRLSLPSLGYLAGILFLGWMVVATNSRGGLLSLMVASAVLLYFKLRKVFYVLGVILIILILIPNPWSAQVFQWKQEDPLAYDRIQIWKSSLSILQNYPLFGVGLGMYGGYFEQYRFPTENWIARYSKTTSLAHNELLQVGAELGIPGLVLAMILVIQILLFGIKQTMCSRPIRSSDSEVRSVSLPRTPDSMTLSLWVSLLAIFVQSLVNSVFHSPAIAITTVILIALLLNQNLEQEEKKEKIDKHLPMRRIIFLSLLFSYFWIVTILYPFLGHVYYFKAQRLLDQGRPLEAIKNLNQAIAYVPIQPYYHDLLGSLYTTAFRNQPNWEAFYGGIKEFSEAIRWNSREPQFYHNRAILHLELFHKLLPTEQTLLNGIADYQKAITLSPFDPFLRYSLAAVYLNIKRYSEAQEQLEKALDLEPNFIGGYYLLSKTLASLGQKEASYKMLEKARNLAKQFNPDSYDSLYLKNLFRWPDRN